MTWSKLAGFVSLKAILVACCLTPVTVPATGITAAHAQFNIIIPGIRFNGYGGRRYGRSRAYHRSARRGGRRGGQQQQEVSGTSSGSGPTPVTSSGANTSAASVPLSSSPTPVTSSRGYRPSTD